MLGCWLNSERYMCKGDMFEKDWNLFFIFRLPDACCIRA